MKGREIFHQARRPYGHIIRRHNRNVLRWARHHLCWTRALWARVLFTDESRLRLSFADWRIRVYLRKSERFEDLCVLERNQFGGGSVIVLPLGWLYGGRKTNLVVVRGNLNAKRYVDNILRHVAVPFLHQHFGILIHDNATPHTLASTRQLPANQNVNVLPWLCKFPRYEPH